MRYPVIRITAGDPPLVIELQELWTYRELLGFLVWRDPQFDISRRFSGSLGPSYSLC